MAWLHRPLSRRSETGIRETYTVSSIGGGRISVQYAINDVDTDGRVVLTPPHLVDQLATLVANWTGDGYALAPDSAPGRPL